MTSLSLHPDRALPFPAEQRSVAREIYAETKDLPLICMHGHVEPEVFADDTPFADPAQLLIVPDHYVFRMLASQGIEPARLGVPRRDGGPVETDSRQDLAHVLRELEAVPRDAVALLAGARAGRGVRRRPGAERRDGRRHLRQDRRLRRRPGLPAAGAARPLPDRDHLDHRRRPPPTCAHHAKLAADGLGERVLPTFRPDALAYLDRPTWRDDVAELAQVSGVDTATYDGFLDALRARRAAFVAAGARATDHGHLLADTTPMEPSAAGELYARVLGGAEASPAEVDAFAANMLFEMAEMSVRGRPGDADPPRRAARPQHARSTRRTGRTRATTSRCRPSSPTPCGRCWTGSAPTRGFRVILFTVDETVYSRELAPIAGTYPSVRLGAPWWFLDSPEGMRRFREAATETAGFYNTSGFVDDTRAYASIPARHDLFRRVDAGYLARLVLEHRLGLDEAIETAVDLAYNLPLESYARPATCAATRCVRGTPSADSASADSTGGYCAYAANGARCFDEVVGDHRVELLLLRVPHRVQAGPELGQDRPVADVQDLAGVDHVHQPGDLLVGRVRSGSGSGRRRGGSSCGWPRSCPGRASAPRASGRGRGRRSPAGPRPSWCRPS